MVLLRKFVVFKGKNDVANEPLKQKVGNLNE